MSFHLHAWLSINAGSTSGLLRVRGKELPKFAVVLVPVDFICMYLCVNICTCRDMFMVFSSYKKKARERELLEGALKGIGLGLYIYFFNFQFIYVMYAGRFSDTTSILKEDDSSICK